MQIDSKYMERALELAFKGLYNASPNPMVGSVIVSPDGKIIGEGYHRKCGGPHAEVNAINSVADKGLLRDSTMYVTLEPCAHHGRTGPCAELIIRMGIPRVVVGCRDPFSKVDGRGIEMMRQAGIEVVEGFMETECRDLNVVFFTAHTLKRPFIGLKWAQTRDGYMDGARGLGRQPLLISSPLTLALGHRLRVVYDAIMVGSGTALADNPTLTARLWPGESPIRIVMDRRRRVPNSCRALSEADLCKSIVISDDKPLECVMRSLYEDHGITSVLVEGGQKLLQSFINAGLWDFARVETGPMVLGEYGTTHAPKLPSSAELVKVINLEGQIVNYYSQTPLLDVKNL